MLEVESIKTPIFGPLSLEAGAGQCVAIRGKSGAGKSLFLRAIADLDPNEGEVWLDGVARSGLPAWRWRRKMVFVPAQSGWWADGVGEHFPPGANTGPLLDALGLPPDAVSWQVSRLSTGERQRLAIARALSLEPGALMLDEPTAALDPEATERVEALILEQLAAGIPVILVTHNDEQAARIASKTFALEEGDLKELVREKIT